MSLEIVATIICDQCGERIAGQIEKTTTDAMRSYHRAKEEAKRRRWVTNLRYGTARHICEKCADCVAKVPITKLE